MINLDQISIGNSFYFIRHGESLNNKLDLVNGWTNCPLTEFGKEQAKKAAEVLKNEPIRRIVTSDLQRAKETAEIIAQELNVTVEIFPELRERNWGIYENKPRAERPRLEDTPEEGESPKQYFDRVTNALLQINISESTLIVGHAGTLRVISTLLNITAESHRVPNGCPVLVNQKGLNHIKWI